MADSGKLMLYSMSMDEQQKTDEKPKNELKTENEGKPKDENADTELDDLLDSKLVQSSHEHPTATSVWAIMDAVTTTIWLWQPLSPDRLNLFFSSWHGKLFVDEKLIDFVQINDSTLNTWDSVRQWFVFSYF